MENIDKDGDIYSAKINLTAGGDYGYTFRVMPKHEMVLEAQNLNLVKWITEEMQKEVTEEEKVTDKVKAPSVEDNIEEALSEEEKVEKFD